MSTPLISPVVPALLPSSDRRATAGGPTGLPIVRGPLPLASLISGRTSHVVYGLAALDNRGRVADRVVMQALSWVAGQRLAMEEAGGLLAVRTDPNGNYQITGQGHLRLPAPLRHRCGLAAGDRVLLAADPDRSRLTVYPPAALDNALAQFMAGGEQA